MKRPMKIFLSMVMTCTCIACSSRQEAQTTTAEPAAQESASTGVEVDEGLMNVDITLPPSFFELMETTPEDYVAEMNEDNVFKNVELLEDGSVKITMSKKDYREFMANLATNIDDGLQEMIDDQENYSNIIDIKANKDYSKFTITLESGEPNLYDTFSVFAFYMYGIMYQTFDGKENPVVEVSFTDKDGKEVYAASSENLKNQ